MLKSKLETAARVVELEAALRPFAVVADWARDCDSEGYTLTRPSAQISAHKGFLSTYCTVALESFTRAHAVLNDGRRTSIDGYADQDAIRELQDALLPFAKLGKVVRCTFGGVIVEHKSHEGIARITYADVGNAFGLLESMGCEIELEKPPESKEVTAARRDEREQVFRAVYDFMQQNSTREAVEDLVIFASGTGLDLTKPKGENDA